MTTPDLPQAAVQAAAEVLCAMDKHEEHDREGACGGCLGAAEEALDAALPLLGDTRTEYTIRVTRDGRTYELDDCADTSHGRAVKSAAHLRDRYNTTTVVQRTVITGEWTEAASE